MALTITVAAHKGGSGKTVTAVTLASRLGSQGHKVLLVDADSQMHATYGVGVEPVADGLVNTLAGTTNAADLIADTDFGLSVLPGDPIMANIDRALASHPVPQTRLKAALSPVRDQFDVIVVDTPGQLGLPVFNALVAADWVLIPVALGSDGDVRGVADLIGTVDTVKDELGNRLAVAGILPIRAKRTLLSAGLLRELTDEYGDLVLPPVRESVRVAEAASWQQPVPVYAPDAPAAVDYQIAISKLTERIGL